ncbi:autotransporter assembly complex protein TamA [Hoeflea prorocentri]|uniref:Autotransporter assembly complex protein TamA n=1 Tax=Hoeflea prorocentri TaxID=1922333 RepID=A0A9X3UFI6_9HYPH|nr:autotransporter assembly complex family protein [Hoeflea prorocentri]MCY6380403.1 autotransporter assembly complex protein TamA [Hoeflea prorocentri]MDA5398203.1 autotransporter assembly complex protein TamA [Hoeflea prorocentri]
MNGDQRSLTAMKAMAFSLAMALLIVTLSPGQAAAFKIFGIRLWGSEDAKEAAEEVPDAVPYDVHLSVDDDAELGELLNSISLLVTKKDSPPSGTIGLLTRAKNDKRRLVAALYSEALYGGTVDILINGTAFENVPIDAVLNRGAPASVHIDVDAGPEFTFARADARTTTGDTIDLAQFGVVVGEPAKSETVVNAESKLVTAWHDDGYAFARIASRDMIADHRNRTLEVDVRLNPGPLAIFGPVTVSGAEDVDSAFIIQQANIPQGTVYSPKRLSDASKRLRGLGVFDSVVIVESEEPGPDNSVSISIEVSERKPRTIGAGVTAATQDGLGTEAFWTHRNLFGRAEQLRIEGAVSGIGRSNFSTSLDYHVAATFTKPGVWGPTTSFKSRLEAQYQDTDAFKKHSFSANAGLEREFDDQLTGSAYLDVEYARFQDTDGPSTSVLVSVPLELIRDTRDDRLNPTTGYRALLSAEPTYDVHNGDSFFKTQAGLSVYRALNSSGSFVLAGRVLVGSIFGADLSEVPADRRFYAGGGGSVRGYEFQSAGPRSGSQPTGGLSLVETSIEARLRVTENIGLAAFIDSGGAFTSSTPGQGGEWFTGAGAGIRYLTPVGPLRVDLGVPLNKISGDPDFGVYLGLGQAF